MATIDVGGHFTKWFIFTKNNFFEDGLFGLIFYMGLFQKTGGVEGTDFPGLSKKYLAT